MLFMVTNLKLPERKHKQFVSELVKFMFLARHTLLITRRNVNSKWMVIACLQMWFMIIMAVIVRYVMNKLKLFLNPVMSLRKEYRE